MWARDSHMLAALNLEAVFSVVGASTWSLEDVALCTCHQVH